MSSEIIIALDVANKSEMKAALTRLPAQIDWFKVGLELFCSEGPNALKPLQEKGKGIFLDLKLHDIPRTVEKAVASVSQHNVDLLTVHASGGRAMLEAAATAARNACGSKPLRTLAVTVLTSLDETDLRAMGVSRSPSEQAVELAKLAYESGIDGVVCSLHEASAIREALGPDALIVTPGIRMPTDNVGDQKRVGTPRDAMNAGASHIVVGRPIMQAEDPESAYNAMLNDMI